MANEYLQRTPTSTGNRKVWTWSTWIKKGTSGVANPTLFSAGNNNFIIRMDDNSSSDKIELYHYNGSTYDYRYITNLRNRDVSSWLNIVLISDTTSSTSSDRIKIYINGSLMTDFGTRTDPSINFLSYVSNVNIHSIGANNVGGSPVGYYNGYISDIFFIDGQALTPDVFGFYKDGDGYMSSGTTQATDFRPGQWSPRLPKSIKHTINRRGGFGVNGFYLPMNDSSNPGADFHCAPNSIIKLKGEDLPQPRNGAPTTTDAYVSQLRSDPNAANLVLAVPGISTATGSNLITNGTFDTNITGWTATDNTQSWNNGQLQINRSGGGGATSYQAITTVVGERYTVIGTVNSSGSRGDLRVYNGTGFGGTLLLNLSGTSGQTLTQTGSFTATSTTSTLGLSVDSNNTTIYVDNIVVKQEDAPRDYSADIKGSGTNRTPTAVGSMGVGYDIPSYYGSAINATGGTPDALYYDLDGTDYGTNDFTFECWFYATETPSTWGILMKHATNGTWANGIVLNSMNNTTRRFTIYTYSSGQNYVTPSTFDYELNQWHHVVAERYNNTLTLYVNGVAHATRDVTGHNYGTADLPSNSSQYALNIGAQSDGNYQSNGYIQDARIYKGVAKYKGGFDVPKPYTPVGIESWRATTDTCKNNFATLNPLVGAGIAANDNAAVLKDGNLYYDNANQSWTTSTIGVSSGKYYAEFMVTGGTVGSNLGVCGDNRHGGNNQQYHDFRGISYIRLNNPSVTKDYNAISVTQTSNDAPLSYESGSIVGITIDFDNKEIKYYKNGTLIRTDSTPASYTPVDFAFYFLAFRTNDGASPVGSNWSDVIANFGQNPSFSGQTTTGTNADDSGKGLFKYAPPTGFLALCEDNLPTPAIADPGEYFKTVLWTGSSVSGSEKGRSISGLGFKPDLVWLKSRSIIQNHQLYDSVRGFGGGKGLSADEGRVEGDIGGVSDTDYGFVSAADDNGFSVLATHSTGSWVNNTGVTYVAWCWKAGGPAVSNPDGTIASQVSANQTAGFSIVTWLSNAVGSIQTLGHGLGKTPDFIIVKNRDYVYDWFVWHKDLANTTRGYLKLNTTDSETTGGSDTWSVSSTTFGLRQSSMANANTDDFVAYCWAEIEGFSKFGSYVGNGNADGPFVYCGFKPAFVLIKRATGGTGYWILWDSSRTPTNLATNAMVPNTNWTETSAFDIDLLSNGFKVRDLENSVNASGDTIIFAAFAESPFQTANAK